MFECFLRVSKIRFHDVSGWTAIQHRSMYLQRCLRTKRQLVCIFKHPVPSSYSADTDTTMHFKAHCLSGGSFMIMQPAKKILTKVASDGELSDHKASVPFCSITFHIRNVFQNCTDRLYCTIKHRRGTCIYRIPYFWKF